MPLIGMYIIMNSGIFETNVPDEFRKYIYIFVSIFSILLPISFLPLLYYWQIISSLKLTARKERFVPLLFTATSLVLLNILLTHNVPVKLFNAYTFSIASVAVLLVFANILIKISLHLSALGGIAGLIFVLSVVYNANLFLCFLLIVIASGLVATARLYNNAHTLREIVYGYILGFATTFGIIYIFLK